MTALKIYQNPNQFWNDVSPHLKFNEAKNSLLLGLSYIFKTNPEDCIYQSALFENNKLLGALVCSQYLTNINLLPSAESSPESIARLFEEFKITNIKINGIVGAVDAANQYAKLFHENGRKTKTHMNQGIYKCKKVLMPQIPSDIKFRKAKFEDVPVISQWIEHFRDEAVPHDPKVNGTEIAKSKIEKNMIYVVEKNGSLLSMACWGRDIETSCSINLVYTPKILRGNGYASYVTAQLTQLFLESGKLETNLYTDMGNPTSNKIYQKIGYEFVGNSIHLGVI